MATDDPIEIPTPSPIQYADIAGFPGYRACHDDTSGWIESCWNVGYRPPRMDDKWRELKSVMTGRRRIYHRVTLCRNGKKIIKKIHVLILTAFGLPKPEGRYECAHWDDDPANNHPGNLRWATHKENGADAIRNGRMASGDQSPSRLHPERVPRGERHWNSKLSDADAIAIRERYAAGGVSQITLALEFGVSKSLISLVLSGKIRSS